jgi:DNA modification methylase
MPLKLPKKNHVYRTKRGLQACGDSRELLRALPESSVDLIVTSPPFALLRQKSYGNEDQSTYVDWLTEFGQEAFRVLKDTGSFVLDLGGAYQRGKPVRSLYNFRVLFSFVDQVGYRLAEEFFWHNPSKLPSPIEWVNKRKIRAKDSVNTVWWFSKTDWPKANVKNVLVPYSGSMKTLLNDPEKFYTPKVRPSGHNISAAFAHNNGGAIPSNLLQISNSESNSHYLRTCKTLGKKSHPARFPAGLPSFFIKFLTDPGDVAETLGRHWLAFEIDRGSAALSAIRFLEHLDTDTIAGAITKLEQGKVSTLAFNPPTSAEDTAPHQAEFELT